jgi:hypothetical protein
MTRSVVEPGRAEEAPANDLAQRAGSSGGARAMNDLPRLAGLFGGARGMTGSGA